VRYGGKVRDIMSKKATEFQRVAMSRIYRGKEIFKPLNTGWIDENVACVREWVANIFFYRRGETTIMIDAGYNYDRLAEKMGWLEIDAKSIRHILITHQDTDHVGAVEADGLGLFKKAKLYIGEIENRYLTGEVRRRVMHRLYKLPQVTINNKKQLLKDGETFKIGNIKIHAFLVPGHTWGHMVYLIDDKYLFTGDTIWFGADGGYSFISALAESNKLAVRSLGILEQKLKKMCVKPLFITGHTGFTDNFEFAFAHKEKLCSPFKKKVHDPSALYDAYDESDDTERNAKNGFLKVAGK
jgi:hydroxyacylglutathione hydrolase